MITIFTWLMALLCPNPSHTTANHGSCNLKHKTTISSNAAKDTGGETGGLPTPPPPPPPPPPGH